MPSAHRSTRASTSSTAQASALAIQRAPAHAASLDRSAYLFDEDEDYDSDMCADLPMPERVSMKIRSLLHAAWNDLADVDDNFPHDEGHDLHTVTANLEGLAEFLVEIEEALAWFRETVPTVDEDDVATLCRIHRTLSKTDAEHGDERGQRRIGPRALVELNMVALTYAELFRGVPANNPALAQVMLARDSRATSRADLRATRMLATESTLGETLVLRVERLHHALETALFECTEEV